MTIPLLVVLLALVDGALLGFRAGAGRTGRIEKSAYRRRSIGLGLFASGLVALGGVGLAAGMAAVAGPESWAVFDRAGTAAAQVFGGFAILMLAALAAWAIPVTELRTAITVTLLGPGTLLRPLVIVAGMAHALVRAPAWPVVVLATYGAVGMLLVEPWLTRRFFPVDERLLPPG